MNRYIFSEPKKFKPQSSLHLISRSSGVEVILIEKISSKYWSVKEGSEPKLQNWHIDDLHKYFKVKQ